MSTVLITGASRGIGAHLARGFSAAGYDVAALARTAPHEVVATLPGLGLALAVDVTNPQEVAQAVARVEQEFGAVDVLVNNAGLIDAEVPLWEADCDQWWDVMAVNVRGPFLLARAVVPGMLARGGGRVINLNSGYGTRAYGLATAYAASKTALFRITGALHEEGYHRGIRAFDMAPGVVHTDMTSGMELHRGRTAWTDPAAVVELALTLASGQADHLSGTYLRVGRDNPQGLPTHGQTLGLVQE